MDSVFSILADPNRRAILALLLSSERSVGEIVDSLQMPQPTASKHLRVLRDAGVVASRVSAQRRVYRLKPKRLKEIDDWLAPFRKFWAPHLDALEAHLDRLHPPKKGVSK
jgi:DNA-binding transcriptional ArsR family regulator